MYCYHPKNDGYGLKQVTFYYIMKIRIIVKPLAHYANILRGTPPQYIEKILLKS